MAVFEFWRDITPGSPNDTVDRYQYDTSDDSISHDVFTVGSGVLGPIHPALGTVMYQECQGGDLVQYKSTGSSASINKVTLTDSPTCCTLSLSDFNVVRTNNTNLLTPNGKIEVTAPVLDIGDYEASIDGGANWVTQVGSIITFSALPAASYSVIIREISGVCNVTATVEVSDNITYPPLLVEEEVLPAAYSPVFHPIEIVYKLLNNTATIKEDGGGTYLEVANDDAKEYLATLPIIKILDNTDYGGKWQVLSVDDVDDPEKFYIAATFTTEQAVTFVPFDKQVFQIFAEVAFNNYQKIADIAAYPNAITGFYELRLEGFLQSVFEVMQPINSGDEITLLRKYYVVPRDFDMTDAPTTLNAVYSAVTPLTPFLGALIPLGPAPINFINEQTAKGFPVLFSYIDLTVGRVKNITSSNQTDIVASGTTVFIPGLPMNEYTLTWVNPAGAIGTLNVTPALPAWITILPSASDTVKLAIDLSQGGAGDYDGTDYDGDDYLSGGPNSIVGCFSFLFEDGTTDLFTLDICVYPIQSSQVNCGGLNIAWINRQGGWSSYIFEGRRTYTQNIGDVKEYKKGGELRRSTVENVYDGIEVDIMNKSIKDLVFIKSLRQSIQAFLFDDATGQWSIPIVLDKTNTAVYSEPFRQIEVDQKIAFKLAEEVVIQSQ